MSEWDAVKTEPAKGSEWDVVDAKPSTVGRAAGAFGESFGGVAKGMLATVGGLLPFMPPKYALQSLSDLGESALPWVGNATPYGSNTALNVIHGLPFIGPAAAQVTQEIGQEKYPEAAGHAAGNVAALLLARRLTTPRAGAVEPTASTPAYVPPYTGTRPGTVVAPELPPPPAAAAPEYAPLLKEAGKAALGVASPRARYLAKLGKVGYDIYKAVRGGEESAAAPASLPPPPAVPEMNTGGPPVAKYTVTGTANRTPYLANVPKRTVPPAAQPPANLEPPPTVHPEGAYDIPPEARTPRMTAAPEHYKSGAQTVKGNALAHLLRIKGVLPEVAQKMTVEQRNAWAKMAEVTNPSEVSWQKALDILKKLGPLP